MSVVTELVALLRLQTDKASFAQGKAGIDSLATSLQTILGADLLGKLGGQFTKVVGQAATLADVSAELGITTDRLQSLQYAGELGGLSAEALTSALGRLASEAGAANSGLGPMADLFKRLGVDTKGANGEILGTGELLPQIADGISKLKSHTEQAAAVQQLFGRGSRALIPILAKGKDGLAELDAEFKKLGGGFTGEQIAAADAYDDQMVKLTVTAKSFGGALIEQVLPPIQKVAEVFTKFSINTKGALAGTQELGAGLAITTGLALAQGVAMLWSSGQGKSLLKLTGIVGGLALAWGEVRTALLGGQTEIGLFLDKAGGIGTLDKAVRNLSAGWQGYADAITAVKKAAAEDPNATGLDKINAARKGLGISQGLGDEFDRRQRLLVLDTAKSRTPAEEAERARLRRTIVQGPQEAKQRQAEAAGIGTAQGRGLGAGLEQVAEGTAAPSAVNAALQSIPGLNPGNVHAETNKDGFTVLVPNVNVNITAPAADLKEVAKHAKQGAIEGLNEAANKARRSRASRTAHEANQ